MVIDVPYQDLTQTLKCIKLQVIDSLPYVSQYIPVDIYTPGELFNYLKPLLTFTPDPNGVELLQTLQTLMSRNGYGDCDCFTIAGLTALIYLGFEPLYVVLTGNSKYNPTHIYIEVWDPSRQKITPFDLTNPIYNMERPYKYKQRLRFAL
jgi:hypothetical protein